MSPRWGLGIFGFCPGATLRFWLPKPATRWMPPWELCAPRNVVLGLLHVDPTGLLIAEYGIGNNAADVPRSVSLGFALFVI